MKITKQQRREKKAKGIDLAIQRWTREQEQDTRLADHAREKKRNGVDAADSPSKTPPSIVGVIQIESPAVACATDDSCGTYTNTSALLEVGNSHTYKPVHQASVTYTRHKKQYTKSNRYW